MDKVLGIICTDRSMSMCVCVWEGGGGLPGARAYGTGVLVAPTA